MQINQVMRAVLIAIGMLPLGVQSVEAGVNIYDIITKPKTTEFEHVVIFGDSLSDANYQDGTRFVAGGPNYPGYFDILSQYFSNKPSSFITYGGTNYAVAAASCYAVYDQIRAYLAENNAIAKDNRLHVLWSGGVDANTAIIFNLPRLPFYDFSQADFLLYKRNKPTPFEMIKKGAQLLLDSGAPYVIVPNVPNAAYAPINSMFHVDVTVTLLSVLLPPPYNKQVGLTLRKIYGRYLNDKLRDLPQGQGHDFLVDRAIDSLKIQFPFIPRSILGTLLNTVLNIQTNVTRQFNHSTLNALMPLDGQIVYLDVAHLFDEIIDNAADWHIGSVNLTACSLSYRSPDCSEENGTFYTDRHYLFGDWFHPSWEGHTGIAQYIIATLNAPDQVASIVKQLDNLNYSSQAYLNNYLTSLRFLPQRDNGWSVFGGYSGVFDIPNSYLEGAKNTYTNLLNLGLNYQFSPNLALGSLLSLSYGKNKPYRYFSYRQNSQSIAFYTQWVAPSARYWLNTNLNYAKLNASHIERMMRLGETYRIEPSDTTNSQMYGVNIRGGWNIWSSGDGPSLQMGPLVGLSYHHYKLKGFEEKYTQATSMHFKDAKYNQFYTSVGWYVNSSQFNIGDKSANLSAEISYNRKLKDQDFQITSRLKTSPIYFKKKVELSKYRQWVELNSNLNIKLDKATTLNTGAGFKLNNKKNKNAQFSIGVQHIFQ